MPETNQDKEFLAWYAAAAKKYGLHPDPFSPEHEYDYRGAFAAKAEPDAEGHWPSTFKTPNHPQRLLREGEEVVDTATGKRGRGAYAEALLARQEGLAAYRKTLAEHPKTSWSKTWQRGLYDEAAQGSLPEAFDVTHAATPEELQRAQDHSGYSEKVLEGFREVPETLRTGVAGKLTKKYVKALASKKGAYTRWGYTPERFLEELEGGVRQQGLGLTASDRQTMADWAEAWKAHETYGKPGTGRYAPRSAREDLLLQNRMIAENLDPSDPNYGKARAAAEHLHREILKEKTWGSMGTGLKIGAQAINFLDAGVGGYLPGLNEGVAAFADLVGIGADGQSYSQLRESVVGPEATAIPGENTGAAQQLGGLVGMARSPLARFVPGGRAVGFAGRAGHSAGVFGGLTLAQRTVDHFLGKKTEEGFATDTQRMEAAADDYAKHFAGAGKEGVAKARAEFLAQNSEPFISSALKDTAGSALAGAMIGAARPLKEAFAASIAARLPSLGFAGSQLLQNIAGAEFDNLLLSAIPHYSSKGVDDPVLLQMFFGNDQERETALQGFLVSALGFAAAGASSRADPRRLQGAVNRTLEAQGVGVETIERFGRAAGGDLDKQILLAAEQAVRSLRGDVIDPTTGAVTRGKGKAREGDVIAQIAERLKPAVEGFQSRVEEIRNLQEAAVKAAADLEMAKRSAADLESSGKAAALGKERREVAKAEAPKGPDDAVLDAAMKELQRGRAAPVEMLDLEGRLVSGEKAGEFNHPGTGERVGVLRTPDGKEVLVDPTSERAVAAAAAVAPKAEPAEAPPAPAGEKPKTEVFLGREVPSEQARVEREWLEAASKTLNLENDPDAQAIGTVLMEMKMDSLSRLRGETKDEQYRRLDIAFNTAREFEAGKGEKTLLEKAKGAITFFEDGRALIRILEKADVSTLGHEMAHFFEHYIPNGHRALAEIKSFLGLKPEEDLGAQDKEAFARLFEMYDHSGRAPTPRLKKVFDQAAEWLGQVASKTQPALKATLREGFDGKKAGAFFRSVYEKAGVIEPEKVAEAISKERGIEAPVSTKDPRAPKAEEIEEPLGEGVPTTEAGVLEAAAKIRAERPKGIRFEDPEGAKEPSAGDLAGIEAEVVADRVIREIKANGGVTISEDGTKRTSGFAFSPYKARERALAAEEVTPESVSKFVGDNHDLLSKKGHYIGGWVDTATGKVYLDVAVVSDSRGAALRAAKKAKQLAIFDLGAGKEIRLDAQADSVRPQDAPGGDRAAAPAGGREGEAPGARAEAGAAEVTPGDVVTVRTKDGGVEVGRLGADTGARVRVGKKRVRKADVASVEPMKDQTLLDAVEKAKKGEPWEEEMASRRAKEALDALRAETPPPEAGLSHPVEMSAPVYEAALSGKYGDVLKSVQPEAGGRPEVVSTGGGMWEVQRANGKVRLVPLDDARKLAPDAIDTYYTGLPLGRLKEAATAIDKVLGDATAAVVGKVTDPLFDLINWALFNPKNAFGAYFRKHFTELDHDVDVARIQQRSSGRRALFADSVLKPLAVLMENAGVAGKGDAARKEAFARALDAGQDLAGHEALTKKVREAFDALADQMVDLGMMDISTATKHKGKYFPYATFQEPNLKATEKAIRALERKKTLSATERAELQRLRERRRELTTAVPTPEGLIKRTGETTTTPLDARDVVSAGARLRHRTSKDIEEALESGLDLSNPGRDVLQTLVNEHRAVEALTLFRDIYKHGVQAKTKEGRPLVLDDAPDGRPGSKVPGYTFVPEVRLGKGHLRTFGELAGKYVHDSLWSQLEVYIDHRGDFGRAYDLLHNFVRKGLTSWRAGGHMLQWIGNPMIWTAHGVPWAKFGEIYANGLRLNAGRDIDQTFEVNGKQVRLTREMLQREGILTADHPGEIDENVGAKREGNPATAMEAIVSTAERMAVPGSKLLDKAYGVPDNASRAGLYVYFRQTGMSHEAAAKQVRQMYDMTNVPRGVRQLSRAWSFFRFQYLMLRNARTIAKRTPWALAKTAMVFSLLHKAHQAMLGVSREEYEKALYATFPGEDAGQVLKRLTAMPWFNNSRGESGWWSVWNMFPQQTLMQGFMPTPAEERSGSKVRSIMLAILGGQSAVFKPVFEVVLNEDLYSGQKNILRHRYGVTGEGGPGEYLAGAGKHIGTAWAPDMTADSVRALDAVGALPESASLKRPDASGRYPAVEDELARLAGIGVRRPDPQKARIVEATERAENDPRVFKDTEGTLRVRGGLSDDDTAEARERLRERDATLVAASGNRALAMLQAGRVKSAVKEIRSLTRYRQMLAQMDEERALALEEAVDASGILDSLKE